MLSFFRSKMPLRRMPKGCHRSISKGRCPRAPSVVPHRVRGDREMSVHVGTRPRPCRHRIDMQAHVDMPPRCRPSSSRLRLQNTFGLNTPGVASRIIHTLTPLRVKPSRAACTISGEIRRSTHAIAKRTRVISTGRHLLPQRNRPWRARRTQAPPPPLRAAAAQC